MSNLNSPMFSTFQPNGIEKKNWEVALGTLGWNSSPAFPVKGNRNSQDVTPIHTMSPVYVI